MHEHLMSSPVSDHIPIPEYNDPCGVLHSSLHIMRAEDQGAGIVHKVFHHLPDMHTVLSRGWLIKQYKFQRHG